jgi:hypothetical protein
MALSRLGMTGPFRMGGAKLARAGRAVEAAFHGAAQTRTIGLALTTYKRFATVMSDFRPVPSRPRTIEITIHFRGDIPPQGLDADEVAAVADGVAKAVQFISARFSDPGRSYNLHLREVRPGSAVFQFLLEAAAVTQTVFPIVFSGGLSIENAGTIIADAIKLLGFLNGKPATSVNVTGENNVVVTNSSGAKITVHQHIYQASVNQYFHSQIEKTVKPLKKKHRKMSIDEDGDNVLGVSSEDYKNIISAPINDNQPITVNIIDATLRVRQPHLDGEDSWKFTWGRNRITAQVRDRPFMEKVRSGEEEFRSGDILRVKLRIEEQQRGKNITKHHYIDEVLHKERSM